MPMLYDIEHYESPLSPVGSLNSEIGRMAVGENARRIKKQLIANNDPRAKDQSFIKKAASWNYRFYGCGVASLEDYVDYIKYHNSKKIPRLRDIDADKWKEIKAAVLKRDKYTCSYCGKVGGILECDHIIPIKKGGTNNLENLTAACRKCNRQKKDKTVQEFIDWKSLKSKIK